MLAVITTTKDERHFALRKTTGFVLSKTCLVAAEQSEAALSEKRQEFRGVLSLAGEFQCHCSSATRKKAYLPFEISLLMVELRGIEPLTS